MPSDSRLLRPAPPPPIPDSTILRANAGMIREFWFQPDHDQQSTDASHMVLVIRQTKFTTTDGTAPETKLIRFTQSEWEVIHRAMNAELLKKKKETTQP